MKFKLKKSMWPIYVAAFAGFVAVVGAYLQYKEKEESDELAKKAQEKAIEWNVKFDHSQTDLLSAAQENIKKAEKLAEANEKNFELSEELNKKSSEIIESNQKLIIANDKLIAAQEETIKKITGSGFMLITQILPEPGVFTIQATSQSDYPIYDATVVVQDMDNIMKLPCKEEDGVLYFNQKAFEKHITQLPSISLGARNAIKMSYQNKIIGNKLKYCFKVISRNDATYQYSTFIYDEKNEIWLHYYRIYSFNIKESKLDKLLAQDGDLPDNYYYQNFHFLKNIGLVNDLYKFE